MRQPHAEHGADKSAGEIHWAALGRGLGGEPLGELVEFRIGKRTGGGAHHGDVASAIAVLAQGFAQVVEFLSGEIGRAGNPRHAVLTVAGRAQAEACRLRRRRGKDRGGEGRG